MTDVVEPPTLLQLRKVLYERFQVLGLCCARLRRVPITESARPARARVVLQVQKKRQLTWIPHCERGGPSKTALGPPEMCSVLPGSPAVLASLRVSSFIDIHL